MVRPLEVGTCRARWCKAAMHFAGIVTGAIIGVSHVGRLKLLKSLGKKSFVKEAEVGPPRFSEGARNQVR